MEFVNRLSITQPPPKRLAHEIDKWMMKKDHTPSFEETFAYLKGMEPNRRANMVAETLNGKVEPNPMKASHNGKFRYFFVEDGRTQIQESREGRLYDSTLIDSILRVDGILFYIAFKLNDQIEYLNEFLGSRVTRIETAIQACFKKKKKLGGVVIVSPEMMNHLPERALRFQEEGGIIKPNYATNEQYLADLRSIVNKAMGGIPSPQYAPALPH